MPAPKNNTANKTHTLDRVISKAGLGSRSEARSWIGAGRVTVNGKKIQTPDVWVHPERDEVALDGRAITAGQNKHKRYILLYKPKGYITSNGDPQGRPTVYDLTANAGTWLSPVGRLDMDTSGLLVLTNDTDFAERVSNPDHKVAKTYMVKASVILS
jgi:23S rRNA pseudouridine2605 synthase